MCVCVCVCVCVCECVCTRVYMCVRTARMFSKIREPWDKASAIVIKKQNQGSIDITQNLTSYPLRKKSQHIKYLRTITVLAHS